MDDTGATRARRAVDWFFRYVPTPRCVVLLLLPYSLFGVVCIVLEATH